MKNTHRLIADVLAYEISELIEKDSRRGSLVPRIQVSEIIERRLALEFPAAARNAEQAAQPAPSES
jgi:hypothetical protein